MTRSIRSAAPRATDTTRRPGFQTRPGPRRTLACAAIGLLAVGCSVDVDPPAQAAWAALVPQLPELEIPPFLAQVAMTSISGETLIRVDFVESTPGQRYDWAVQYGTCEDPREFISSHPDAFPPLTITPEGNAEIIVFLLLTLTDNSEYSVVIFDDLSQEPFDLVGCATMEVVEGDPN